MPKPTELDGTTPIPVDVVGSPFKASTGFIYLPVKLQDTDDPFFLEFDPSDGFSTARVVEANEHIPSA